MKWVSADRKSRMFYKGHCGKEKRLVLGNPKTIEHGAGQVGQESGGHLSACVGFPQQVSSSQ